VPEELNRGNDAKTVPIEAAEVPEVEGNDELTVPCDGSLENHIVVGIRECGPPEKVDLLVMTDGAEVFDDGSDVLGRERCDGGEGRKNLLVFKHEGYGKDDLKAALTDQLKEAERDTP
jgi:hypothetical protein